jgi:hypothetical protein
MWDVVVLPFKLPLTLGCQYFDDNKSALKDQKVFEKKLFEKTSRSNCECRVGKAKT